MEISKIQRGNTGRILLNVASSVWKCRAAMDDSVIGEGLVVLSAASYILLPMILFGF